MTSATIANENSSMPPNTISVSTTTSNLTQTNNCGSNQQTEVSSFTHHLHQPLNSTSSQIGSQAHYQSPIALPTALNASSTFYTPHFTMHTSQFSPITSSTPIVAVSALANGGVASSIGINQSAALYGKVQQSVSNSFCNGDDNSSTVAFMEPTQSVILGVGSNEDTSVNSSGSGSLAGSNCSAVSSCSGDNNGGTSSSGSTSSLTSASQYELYHANSPYSKYRQTEIKPESNVSYNEKYLHAFRYSLM